jgi:hypothetical protein
MRNPTADVSDGEFRQLISPVLVFHSLIVERLWMGADGETGRDNPPIDTQLYRRKIHNVSY